MNRRSSVDAGNTCNLDVEAARPRVGTVFSCLWGLAVGRSRGRTGRGGRAVLEPGAWAGRRMEVWAAQLQLGLARSVALAESAAFPMNGRISPSGSFPGLQIG